MENSVDAPDRVAALAQLGEHYAALARAQRRLRGRDAMQPGRLTAPQVNLLRPLAVNGPMASGQLAEAAGLTPATATHMLDQLAVVGIVERVRRTDDRRVVDTELTQQGKRALNERIAEMEQAWSDALEGFEAAELESATGVLEAICRFVDGL
jgi:DNA-binding MarR family transcriptional regulator